MALLKSARLLQIIFAVTFLCLAGCGTGARSISSGSMGSGSMKAGNFVATADQSINISKIPSGPGAKFEGCWYKQGRHYYQGVNVSVTDPGTYTFNAILYYGTTCDPNDFADQFGFGQKIEFGGFGYIFWFDAFANQKDMSALWYVGNDVSKCVNYEVAPVCN